MHWLILYASRGIISLDQLESALNLLNGSKPKQLILCDFYCPDIGLETITIDVTIDVIGALNTTSRYLHDILDINNVYFDNMVSQKKTYRAPTE